MDAAPDHPPAVSFTEHVARHAAAPGDLGFRAARLAEDASTLRGVRVSEAAIAVPT